jgi:hypothetical protein
MDRPGMDRRGGWSETSGTSKHRIHGGSAHEPPVEVGSGTGSVVGAGAAVVVGGAGGGTGAVVLGGALGGAAFEVDGGAATVVPGSSTTGGAAGLTFGTGRVDRDAGGALRTAFVAGAFFATGAFWTLTTVV